MQVFNITERDRFLLLGCDGFFSVFNPDEAAAAVMRHINDGRPVKNLCERLINEVTCMHFKNAAMTVLFTTRKLVSSISLTHDLLHGVQAVRVRRCRDNCSVLAIIFHRNA